MGAMRRAVSVSFLSFKIEKNNLVHKDLVKSIAGNITTQV